MYFSGKLGKGKSESSCQESNIKYVELPITSSETRGTRSETGDSWELRPLRPVTVSGKL